MANKSKFLVSEITMSYHPKVKPTERPQICDSRDAYKVLIGTWDMGKIYLQEECKMICLNRNGRVLGVSTLSTGGMAQVALDPKLVVLTAVGCLSTSIILAHNHPSGSLKPSKQDLRLTEKIKMAAQYFDITLKDHLIITPDDYYSMADEGDLEAEY